MTTPDNAVATRRRPRFGVLVIGQTVSSFGDAFANVAMPLLVLRLTGSVADMGVVAGLSSACQLVGGLISGPVVDRVDRRLLLLACDGAQVLLVGSIPFVFLVLAPDDLSRVGIYLVYFVVIVSSILITVYQVAFRSSLPQIVGRSTLVQANATLTIATQVAYGIGPAMAGVVVAAVGETQALGLNAATFVVAAASWYLVKWRKVNTAHQDEALAVPLSGRLAGVVFLWRNPVLRSLTILDTAAGLIGAGAMTLFIYYVRTGLGGGTTAVGVLLSIGSVGAVGAALVARRLRDRCGFGPAWLIGLGCQGTALVLVPLADSVVPVAALVALFGFGQTLSLVLGLSYRQERTPDSHLGRVTAAATSLLLAASTAGSVTSTAIASHVPTQDIFVALGLLGLVVAAVGCATPLRRRGGRATARRSTSEVDRGAHEPDRTGSPATASAQVGPAQQASQRSEVAPAAQALRREPAVQGEQQVAGRTVQVRDGFDPVVEDD
jgi:MFS family permease